jgi:serine/threonine protein kinase/WD40 repeat protein
MPSNPSNSSNLSSRFQSVLAEILKAEDDGQSIDVERYCRSFPELAKPLRDYFRNRKQFGGLASALAPSASRSTAPQEMAPGSQFAGYEILRELGHGGMGVVYLARQRSVNRLVALKLIRKDRLEHLNPEQRRQWLIRFRTEGQAAARVAHDRIVTVYVVGIHDGHLFYSMRYVEGRSLAEQLKAGPLPNRSAAILMEQVARAMQAVHEQGVLHRDLKPHNILVDAQGRPYVTDFGLAKCSDTADSLTHTGEMLGSAHYMSPEQAEDSANVSAATDVYGLGATLYALLTGRPPFQGTTVAETLHQVKYREPLPPRRVNPAVDRDLNTITLRCLEKEPGRRFGSAAALADELQRYLEGRPILSRPVGPSGRLWRWCRRKPILASLSAAALFLMMLSGGLYLANRIETNRRQQAELAYESAAERGDKAEEDIRALAYLKDMGHVHQLIDSGEHANAREALNKWRDSPYSAWEWHFAAARLRDAGFLLSGQRSQPLAGDRAEGFTIPAGLAGHRREVLAVAISPDGTRLASADAEAIVKIWDLTDKNKKLLHKLTAPSNVTALAWSPNGKSLAAACQGSLVSGPPAPAPVPPANALPPKAKGPPNQGKQPPTIPVAQARLAGGTVVIWDVNTTRKVTLRQVPDINPPPSFPPPPRNLGPNPSQEELKAESSRQLAEQEARSSRDRASTSLIWCPNRKLVLADRDGKLQIWDLTNALKRDPVSVLTPHDGGVHSAALSPDGNRLATVSFDGVTKIWDLGTVAQKPLVTLKVPPREKFNTEPTYSLVWTKEGKCINVVSRYGEIREVDMEAQKVGEPRKLIPRDPNVEWAMGGVGTRGERFVWSPDAKLVVSVQGMGELKIWDAATGKEGVSMVAPGAGPGIPPLAGATCAPAWDSSGLRLVIGGSNGAIQAWPVVLRRKAVRTPNIPGPVCWSADSRFLLGTYVYSTAEDEYLIEQRKMGEEAIKIMQDNFRRNGGGISPPDPRLLELGKRGVPQGNAPLRKPRPLIKIHDSISGEVVRTFVNTTDRSATTPNMLVASPDGKWVASLTHPGLIQVWPLTKGEQAAPITVEKLAQSPVSEGGSQSTAILLAWSPDSRLLAYTDSAIQIWDVESRKKLRSLQREGKPYLRSLAWNPDCIRLAAATLAAEGKDAMVEVWDVRNSKVVCAFPYYVKYEPHISRVRPDCSAILSWCCDKKRLAVFSDDCEVKIVDVDAGEEGKEITTLHGRPSVFDVPNTTHTVAWSPDGRRLAYASQDETIILRDTITWQEVLTLGLPKRSSLIAPPFGIGFGGRLAWSPDGWQLAYFTGGGVLIWDAKLEAVVPVQPMPEPANAAQGASR